MTQLSDLLKAIKPQGGSIKIRQTHPHKAETAYRKVLRESILGLAREIKPMVKAELAGQRNDSVGDLFRGIQGLVSNTLSGEAIAQRVGSEVVAAQDGNINKAVSRALGVDFIVPGSQLDELIDDWVVQNTALIKDLQENYLLKVQNTLSQGFRQGLTNAEIAKQINAATGVGLRRAKNIARNEVGNLNAAVTKQRDEELGIDEFEWLAVMDVRTRGNPNGNSPDYRPSHWNRNGKVYTWKDGAPGGDTYPGTAINCFPGSVDFNFSNGCNKLWRRKFSGNISTIVTSTGITLEATPNHPILSGNEWKPIEAINNGDDIIQPVSYGGLILESDVHKLNSRADEVFDLMSSICGLASSPGSELDFHGDGVKENIDTIYTNRLLSDNRVSAFLDLSSKLGFSRALSDFSLSEFSGFGKSDSSIAAMLYSAHCIMSGRSKCEPILGSHIRHTDKVGLTTISPWDMVVSKYSGYDTSRDAELLREFKNANTLGVESANISLWKIGDSVVCRASFSSGSICTPSAEMLAYCVSVAPDANSYFFDGDSALYERVRVIDHGFRYFSGHVYNLESDSGWYLANGIVSHNCRCSSIARINWGDD